MGHDVTLQGIGARARALVLGILLLVSKGRGYPGGAPDVACQSMLPTGHGAGPQSSKPPFSIFVSKDSYKPGETLQVVVQADGDNYFRGILLQARMVGCNVNETKLVGVFTNTDSELETKHCFGEVHSAVSHNSSRRKKLKVFYWTAPVLASGHVIMRATMVRQTQEYWTEVVSPVVTDLQATIDPECYPTMLPRPSPPPRRALPSQPIDVPSDLHVTVQSSVTSVPQPVTPEDSQHEEASTQQDPAPASQKVPAQEQHLPSWLGPSFSQSQPPAQGKGVEEAPSWLIPAYQRAPSSSPAPASVVRGWSRADSAVAVVSLWIALFMP